MTASLTPPRTRPMVPRSMPCLHQPRLSSRTGAYMIQEYPKYMGELKLHLLLYYAQVYAVKFGTSLHGQPINAAPAGPVTPSLSFDFAGWDLINRRVAARRIMALVPPHIQARLAAS